MQRSKQTNTTSSPLEKEFHPMSDHESSSPPLELDSMSLEQLHQIKQQEESRWQALTSHYAQLRHAALKVQASQRAVLELGPAVDGKQVLVPLTESVYVPGRIKDPNRLLIELGTGYYVEMNGKDTLAYLDRKMRLVEVNSENITTVIHGTRRNIEAISMSMEGKMLEIRAKQEGRVHRAAVEGAD
jgi:prefoldin alpha subunit